MMKMSYGSLEPRRAWYRGSMEFALMAVKILDGKGGVNVVDGDKGSEAVVSPLSSPRGVIPFDSEGPILADTKENEIKLKVNSESSDDDTELIEEEEPKMNQEELRKKPKRGVRYLGFFEISSNSMAEHSLNQLGEKRKLTDHACKVFDVMLKSNPVAVPVFGYSLMFVEEARFFLRFLSVFANRRR
ncbi:hypothetical protein U1Q18_040530 [Sarracenia purpurea var. burkii]